MEIVKESSFRSHGDLSNPDDMVRVVLDMSVREWHKTKQLLKSDKPTPQSTKSYGGTIPCEFCKFPVSTKWACCPMCSKKT